MVVVVGSVYNAGVSGDESATPGWFMASAIKDENERVAVAVTTNLAFICSRSASGSLGAHREDARLTGFEVGVTYAVLARSAVGITLARHQSTRPR